MIPLNNNQKLACTGRKVITLNSQPIIKRTYGKNDICKEVNM